MVQEMDEPELRRPRHDGLTEKFQDLRLCMRQRLQWKCSGAGRRGSERHGACCRRVTEIDQRTLQGSFYELASIETAHSDPAQRAPARTRMATPIDFKKRASVSR